MNSEQIRQEFLKFFAEHEHIVIPSSSLIPDDPSVLLTTAGMQQFKKYYTGELNAEKDFLLDDESPAIGTASIQKCFRTSDIDEVGDESHLTFFEMLGNFSFGGYFKKESIEYGREFITEIMKLSIEHVTVFDPEKVPEGDWRKGVPFDEESYNFWKSILPEEKVQCEGTDNFWGPTGNEGPCGPTTEIYVKNSAGKPVEIWNIVFNEFYRDSNNNLKKLETPGVDTGMGLERLAMVSQNVPTIFETDLFKPLIDAIQPQYVDIKTQRILADHIRAVIYLIGDGVEPGNKDRGYILRRLLRRIALNIGKEAVIPLEQRPPSSWNERTYQIIKSVKDKLIELDKGLQKKDEIIDSIIHSETNKFIDLLKSGSELEEVIKKYKNSKDKKIPGKEIFMLYSSLGIPIDYIKDEIKKYRLVVDEEGFEEERRKHQEISRAGQAKKFGGHGLLLDTGELKAASEEEVKKVVSLHTATHLLHWALREVLGKDVKQMGSDINPERTRFDFSFSRKMTPEEIKKVEELVNQKIKEDLPVSFKEMPKEDAEKTGALHFFRQKYPDRVKVYYIGRISVEFCGGPHVSGTAEIGKFKILKEEAVGAGTRRIRATLT